MALIYKVMCRNTRILNEVNFSTTKLCCKRPNPVRILASGICYQNTDAQNRLFQNSQPRLFTLLRPCTTQSSNNNQIPEKPEPKKGLIQRFKEMYRDYWYVVLPVHMTTSAIWFGSFYYAVRCGVDVISLLEYFSVSEKIVTPLRDSSAGYFALAFALYKLATPLRYAVTIGGTTFAIRRLQVLGWIKPVPSREQLKEMIQEKKDNLQGRIHESKQHYQTQIKEKRTQVIEEMKRYKTEMNNIKNKVKKM